MAFQNNRRIQFVAAFAVSICAMGCGSKQSFKLAPVSGVVTLDNKPVPQAEVVFQPFASGGGVNAGPGSVARADDTGHFVLKTVKDEPGAVVGQHSVAIYSHRAAPPSSSDTDVGPPKKEMIPARYNVQTTLTFDVPAGGTTTADFKLTSK